MKLTLILASVAAVAVAASTTMAADINVMGAGASSNKLNLRTMDDDSTTKPVDTADMRIATKDLLNNPTALVNKNTLATDNNIFISRSNLVFTQNDRIAMRQKVDDVIQKAKAMAMKKQDDDQQDMENDEHMEQAQSDDKDITATATLTKSVLRAVSASDKDQDSAVMTKASAVVAAKDMDTATLAKRIADFVDTVGKREMEQEEELQQKEQAIQSHSQSQSHAQAQAQDQAEKPRSIMVLIGTKDMLRKPTAAVNKNVASSDNQITISRSAIQPSQNDRVVLTGQAKVADAVLPASAINVDTTSQLKKTAEEPQFRVAIAFRKEVAGDGDASKQEQFGLWGAGWGLGWRYPLSYWNTVGFGLYGGGGGCGLGFPLGGFYYC